MDKLDFIISATRYVLLHNVFVSIFPYKGIVIILAGFVLQCFLNAIVQCLSHTQGLRDYCLTKTYLQDMCSSQEPELMNGGRIVPYELIHCANSVGASHPNMGWFEKFTV